MFRIVSILVHILTQLKIFGASGPALWGKQLVQRIKAKEQCIRIKPQSCNKFTIFEQYCLPISRSCHGCAATVLRVKDERILSLRGGCGVCWQAETLFGVSIGGAISSAWNEIINIIFCITQYFYITYQPLKTQI